MVSTPYALTLLGYLGGLSQRMWLPAIIKIYFLLTIVLIEITEIRHYSCVVLYGIKTSESLC